MEVKSIKTVRVMVYSDFVNYVKEHLAEFEKLRVSLPTASVKKRATLSPNKRPSNDLLGKPKRPKSHGEGKNATLDEFVIKLPSPVSECAPIENAKGIVDVALKSKDAEPEISNAPRDDTPAEHAQFDSEDKDQERIEIDLTSDVESSH